MKKILYILFIIILSISLTGCIYTIKDDDENKNSNYIIYVEGHPECSFIYIYKDEWTGLSLIYNEKTKILYQISTASHTSNDFVELHNADGTPLLYEGE